ncbi:TetR family transcriptional regulator [Methylovirgula ligni]|uniref:TetR family transcriptional regulator n=2 Tax=Methylovirgula ligni TaxID=569860 RepID=A0A3D9YUD7_9HYPH|nr:TetR/AcrR family transcriptional regulator [Methylovirgula ligni]REF84532.1 TetR family transcriptional regulator [Methylovirgula ligni]
MNLKTEVMNETRTGRRRGAALEDAILDAAWDELVERGYSGLTLEGAAKRAGTSRPVLNRRWPSRLDLAAAALARYITSNPVSVPDLGAVRDELILLLRQLSDRGAPALIRLMLEMSEDLAAAGSSFSWLRSRVGDRSLVENILKRGVERGEIDPARLTPRIASLATDLARHEAIMRLDRIPDAVINEIVDEIFLPLVSPGRR